MKNFITQYMSQLNATNIQVVGLQKENEYRVQATLNGKNIFVDIAAHGSSTGFAALIKNKADIAMSSRPIKEQEVQALLHFGDMKNFDNEHVIAIDGLAVIVSPYNPISQLKVSQVAKIFSGEIKNWKELGGEDRKIQLYARDENSGTWDTFRSLVLGKKHKLHNSAKRFESNDELSTYVTLERGAIGFVGLASVGKTKRLALYEQTTKPLAPNELSVATEDYILSRRLFLYAPKSLMSAEMSHFLEYIHSREAQSIVRSTGFISQEIISVATDIDHEAPPEYVSLLKNAKRLSVNMRFDKGSAILDTKALRDMDRLVKFMKRKENSNKELILVGFADPKETERRAEVLSRHRAIAVKAALMKNGISSEPVSGFGSYLPVASDTLAGKIKNRRVEVWIKESHAMH
ncbi:MAG: substrate-binding domain-containing protein [Cellvibrionaceae bacterium]